MSSRNDFIQYNLQRSNYLCIMKMSNTIWAAAVAALFVTGCGNSNESTPVETSTDASGQVWTSYGEAFELGITTAVAEVPALLAQTGKAEGQFEVEIVETCTKMGCWMSVDGPEGEPIMVYMKDHAFFVPKSGMAGKRAIISGYAYNDTVSVELQKHLLEDANRSQEEIDDVTEEKYELAFSAAGVKIEGHIEAEEVEDEEGHDHDDHEGHSH